MNFITHPLLLLAACATLMTACSKPAETSAVQASAASAANVSDGEVTTHVKTALGSEPSLDGLDITVITTKGDIRLTGVVKTQTQIDTAIRIARAAEGAHTIHDELTIQ